MVFVYLLYGEPEDPDEEAAAGQLPRRQATSRSKWQNTWVWPAAPMAEAKSRNDLMAPPFTTAPLLALAALLSGCGAGGLMAAQEGNPAAPPVQGPGLQVHVNEVLVPVVVRDAEGHVVNSLTREQFQVFDRGKIRPVTGFVIEKRSAGKAGDAPLPAASATAGVAPGYPPDRPRRFVALLFDDRHMEEAEVLRARSLATKALGESLEWTDAVAVLSMSGVNSGFSRDPVKLAEAIRKVQAQNLYRHTGRECPMIDYYLADQIVNHHVEIALESAIQNYQTCANLNGVTRAMAEHLVQSVAMRELEIGDQDARVTLSIVREVVREMGTLPGERTLILISSGFLTPSAEAMSLKSQIMDVAASQNVTVNALDARGVYTTEIAASEQGAGSMLALVTGNDSAAQRSKAVSSENVMAELSDGTGGTYFHNSNDLQGGLRRLLLPPEYVYVLECPLADVKPDGSYHHLAVKVAVKNLTVQTRRGYFAPKAAGKKH